MFKELKDVLYEWIREGKLLKMVSERNTKAENHKILQNFKNKLFLSVMLWEIIGGL